MDQIDLNDRLCKAYQSDSIVKELIQLKQNGSLKLPNHLSKLQISLVDLEIRDNRLYHLNRLYVPEDGDLHTKIIGEHHNTPAAGHGGRKAT
ncbi:hypothetical protein HI914_06255 [Erysiphe necator]|nr:hypothetical protein HI914_06255 [Erysiphe necator]